MIKQYVKNSKDSREVMVLNYKNKKEVLEWLGDHGEDYDIGGYNINMYTRGTLNQVRILPGDCIMRSYDESEGVKFWKILEKDLKSSYDEV